MNIRLQGSSYLFAEGQSIFKGYGLKSTEQKLERQMKCQAQTAYFEEQKENLKNVKCNTLEEIANKLDMLQTYENEIAAAKKAYNNEQMLHVMDEAKELGEKIAEAAKRTEPKTPEERREEMIEEALETDESEGEGLLEEIAEDATKMMEDIKEQLLEETTEKAVVNNNLENAAEQVQDMEAVKEVSKEQDSYSYDYKKLLQEDEWEKFYQPIDFRV